MKSKLLITMLLCACGAWSVNAQTQFWGTTMWGGATGQGTIFTADASGGNFQIAYSFVNATGAMPLGGVTLANNNKLYGVTELGGFGDSCVVYCYDPATGNYTNIHDFFQNIQLGYNAVSPLTNTASGDLYGLTQGGGANGVGVIYKIDVTTNSYTDVHNFNTVDGSNPMGSLMQLTNGKLYGTTAYGGSTNHGTIFSYDPVTFVYTKLYNFNTATGTTPMHDALLQATNSKLYGLASAGGANGDGVLYSFDVATGIYTDLYDFDNSTGSLPQGSLIQASNGVLYGTTSQGGTNNKGVIFSFDIATGIYTDLHDFSSSTGTFPQRGVMEGSNGKLYGTTSSGGDYNRGVAYRYNISTGIFYKLHDFDITFANPDCQILETPILTPLGIADAEPSAASAIYPNPATNSLTVMNADKDDVFEFTDLSGKELLSLRINSNSKAEVDISGFPNMFFVKRPNGEITKVVRK